MTKELSFNVIALLEKDQISIHISRVEKKNEKGMPRQ